MTTNPPPNYDIPIGSDNKFSINWVNYFQQTYDGDAGTLWTPNFVSLTTVGTPVIEGKYYRLTRYLTVFKVVITPGTNTSATAGTTYIDNYPVTFTGDGIVFAVSGNLGTISGHIVASSNRIYVPTWTAVTVPLTLIGFGEAT